MAGLAILNPRRARRRRRKMTAKQRYYFGGGRRRKRGLKRRARGRRPEDVVIVATGNPKRRTKLARRKRRRIARKHRRRSLSARLFGRKRHRVSRRRYRRNPIAGISITNALTSAAIGAAGAYGVNYIYPMLPLPSELQSGWGEVAGKLAGAAAVGFAVGAVAGSSTGAQAMVGAMTFTLANLAIDYFGTSQTGGGMTGAPFGYGGPNMMGRYMGRYMGLAPHFGVRGLGISHRFGVHGPRVKANNGLGAPWRRGRGGQWGGGGGRQKRFADTGFNNRSAQTILRNQGTWVQRRGDNWIRKRQAQWSGSDAWTETIAPSSNWASQLYNVRSGRAENIAAGGRYGMSGGPQVTGRFRIARTGITNPIMTAGHGLGYIGPARTLGRYI